MTNPSASFCFPMEKEERAFVRQAANETAEMSKKIGKYLDALLVMLR